MRTSAIRRPAQSVIWQDVECGAYDADLALWSELAREAAGPVLELGCGTGRVAHHLARAGCRVTALDRDPDLLGELRDRARGTRGVDAVVGDARRFELGRRFALVIAPMQLAHLLGGEPGRAGMLRCAARHLAPGGAIAISLLAAGALAPAPDVSSQPLPDVSELDGWVYSSLPIEVRATGAGLEIRRLRQTVSPSGELTEAVDITVLDLIDGERLAAEAAAAGLRSRERLEVPATADHVGSTVLVFEEA